MQVILIRYAPLESFAIVVEDLTEDGNVVGRLRHAIREKNVPGSTWGATVETLTPDDYMMAGLELIKYEPFPEEVDYNEIIVLEEDEIPF